MEPIKCSQCGASITTVERSQVVITGASIVIRRGNTITCEHCGTEFTGGDELSFVGEVNIAVVTGSGSIA